MHHTTHTTETTGQQEVEPSPGHHPGLGADARPTASFDWRDETGAQTAEYGIVTLAAVGFAGLLAVILASGDVQTLLTDLIKGALTLD